MKERFEHTIESKRIFHSYTVGGALIPLNLDNNRYLKHYIKIHLDLP